MNKEGQEALQAMVQIPLHLWEGEVQTRSDIHTAVHGKPAMEQAPDDLWRGHLWRGTHIKTSFLVTIENPHWSSLILPDCSPWRVPMLVQGKKCEERGAAQK